MSGHRAARSRTRSSRSATAERPGGGGLRVMHQSGRPETTPLDATTARPNRRAMTLAWIAIVGLFLLSQPRGDAAGVDPVRFVFTVMAVFLPVAMIWVAAA